MFLDYFGAEVKEGDECIQMLSPNGLRLVKIDRIDKVNAVPGFKETTGVVSLSINGKKLRGRKVYSQSLIKTNTDILEKLRTSGTSTTN